jgi:NCS2 family nucleobase:cation symporter-2/xanthine permease XanP
LSSENTKLLYDVDETPPAWLVVVMGLQHVMLIYSEIVIFPVIIGKKAGAPMEHIIFASFAAALVSGIITLVQVIRCGRIGTGYVLFMGSSAAYMAGSADVVAIGGFALLASLSILVAPIEMILAYFLRFLRHIFTPIVGGIILMLVVLSLVSISYKEWMGEHGEAMYGSWQHFTIGFVTLFVLLGVALFGNRSLRIWCPTFGMISGVVTAWYLGVLNLDAALSQPWIGMFHGSWPGLDLNLKLSYLPLFFTLAVLTLINGVQSIGNSMAIQRISHRTPRKIDYGVVQGTVYADAIGNVLSGLMGTVPNETYSENISVIKVTGVASRVVGICGAIILILLPLSPKISMIMVSLPMPVYGGFLVGLSAMMFPAALELVFTNGMTHRSGLLVGISLCIGIVAESGLFFPHIFPASINLFFENGVAAGGLVAVILSVLFRFSLRRGYGITVAAQAARLPELQKALERTGEDLDLSQVELFRLQLACEELFMHIAAARAQDADCGLHFRVAIDDDELAVEVILGHHLDDIHNHKIPRNLMQAETEETEHLGLTILKHLVKELHQAEISGITYIWFKLA